MHCGGGDGDTRGYEGLASLIGLIQILKAEVVRLCHKTLNKQAEEGKVKVKLQHGVH